jgi:hypothetical protein
VVAAAELSQCEKILIPQDPLHENMNNKKVKRTEMYLFFDFEGSKFLAQSFLLMIMMFSTTSNPLIYFFLYFYKFLYRCIISYYPCPDFKMAEQVIQKFRSKQESLRLLEVITELV